jgi:hypothetical protein
MLSLSSSPVKAQGFRYGDFSDTSKLALNGTLSGVSTSNFPMKFGTALRLTTFGGGEAASAWYKTKQPIAGGFTSIFQFQITNTVSTPADGIAFVIQNAAAGTTALGGAGGAIGYGGGVTCTGEGGAAPCTDDSAGIPASLAVEFDTYHNFPWDHDANHVAVQSCGASANTSDHTNCNFGGAKQLSSITLADGHPHTAFIQYVPGTCSGDSPAPNLTLSLDSIDNVVLSTCVNLSTLGVLDASGNAYVGFTSGTGASIETDDILNWEFVTPITVPLIGNAATNVFGFPFAQYDVIYPADFGVSNRTMTIAPAVYSKLTCTNMIDSPLNAKRNFSGDEPTCTTFADLYNLSTIFDMTCSWNGAAPTSDQCPKTSGFDPFVAGAVHSNEDIINFLVYTTNDPTPIAPQMLTAPEGSNNWVPFGIGFQPDCCTRGSGTSSYNSLVVSADFPITNPTLTIPPYLFKGFASPVANQAPGVVNLAKAGSTIPLKWQLSYPVAPSLGFNGGPVTNLNFAPVGFLSLSVTGVCSTNSNAAADATIPVDTETNTGLMNLGGGNYQFNWQTPKSLVGQCVVVTANTGDGVNHNANIMFH